jgi:hypothetical protein
MARRRIARPHGARLHSIAIAVAVQIPQRVAGTVVCGSITVVVYAIAFVNRCRVRGCRFIVTIARNCRVALWSFTPLNTNVGAVSISVGVDVPITPVNRVDVYVTIAVVVHSIALL